MRAPVPAAGKPQLFFLAISLVDDGTLREGCLTAKEASEYVLQDGGDFFGGLRLPQETDPDLYTYEGWACQILAEDFLSANEALIRKEVAQALGR